MPTRWSPRYFFNTPPNLHFFTTFPSLSLVKQKPFHIHYSLELSVTLYIKLICSEFQASHFLLLSSTVQQTLQPCARACDDEKDLDESLLRRCMQGIWGSVIKCWTGKSELRLPCAKYFQKKINKLRIKVRVSVLKKFGLEKALVTRKDALWIYTWNIWRQANCV